jgi:hypothetical protein
MNFAIRKDSMLPVLTVEVSQDGFHSSRTINERLQNATISFFMEEIGSCIPMIQCGECCLFTTQPCNECPEKVYIQYKWTANDTKKAGKYRGWFEITFLDDNSIFIAPVKDSLLITIIP